MNQFHNHVQLVGRCGNDVATKLLSDGSRIARLRLYQPAPPRSPAADGMVHHLVAWDGLARQMEARVRRGDQLLVHGQLRHRKRHHEGATLIVTEVHVRHFARLRGANAGAEPIAEGRKRSGQ
ncbi:single-stranded DNA-binding protein [Lewinella sp. IMCC34183]|uniref:single-stranded DNA-binding protein n=1 Tax=Lewinella sp. IMCC34183 TaxID=2248762 RepID=UPI000E23F573|nr:single-stranded DNA-binding protein [Lewinella sp. IMCC34183]